MAKFCLAVDEHSPALATFNAPYRKRVDRLPAEVMEEAYRQWDALGRPDGVSVYRAEEYGYTRAHIWTYDAGRWRTGVY